jgi:DNA invertase Pin-like site-specific DNA recombinase
MNAVIYARYSSQNQTEQSIDGQIRECTEFAERNGIQIINTYIDRAVSGTSAEHRTAFQKMISDSVGKQFQAVLVYKLDRFAETVTILPSTKLNSKRMVLKCYQRKRTSQTAQKALF